MSFASAGFLRPWMRLPMLTMDAGSVGGSDGRRSAREGADQLMAQRPREKVKRSTARAKAQPAPAASTADARLKALEQERDRLKSELEAARQRIAALEESRSLVASRIDWVIESLSGVVDRSG
jgi:chromosome segregation ATPase